MDIKEKMLIRSTLIARGQAMCLNEFLNLYKLFVGKPLPYLQLGFGSPVDMLYSLPDVVQVTEDGDKYFIKAIFNDETKHLERLILNQRSSDGVRKKKEDYFIVRPDTLFRLSFVHAKLKAEILHIIAHFKGYIQFVLLPLAYEKILKKPLILKNGLTSLAEILYPIKQIKLLQFNKKVIVCDTEYDQNLVLNCMSSDLEIQNDENLKLRILKCNQNFDKSGISKEVQNIFIKVMKQNPDGVLAMDFPSSCEAVANGSFNLHAFGYVNLVELIDSLPSIFRREDTVGDDKNYLILPANTLQL
ncbi:tudor domain-containing protein 5-like [Uloborus diversus]|uniref:tudor domain-containing protein 5-like n=1 Tax=Uloborus diversus TaxID=327109 RepID=UPI002409E453|nr:tudor domain-containing protein 5-like [Uloborus diversus]